MKSRQLGRRAEETSLLRADVDVSLNGSEVIRPATWRKKR